MYQMALLSKIKCHSDAVDYLEEFPFYNKSIKKSNVKRLKNIDPLAELPFYEQLSVIKTDQAFRGYAMSYKAEIIERKNPIVQLEASKLSIKNLFSDLLNETKGFKYQITVKVLLKKYKLNGEIEFAPVYFNSVTKTVINHKFRLENSFQEILYMIDVWINNGSGWNVESIESQYINISTYRPLSVNSYMDLPVELRNPRKGLINIKNKDQKTFLWCYVRHTNPSKEYLERITEKWQKKLLKSSTRLRAGSTKSLECCFLGVYSVKFYCGLSFFQCATLQILKLVFQTLKMIILVLFT